MKTITRSKTQTVTNTQLVTAIAAAFLAGGLAFASLPSFSKKNIDLQGAKPASVLEKNQGKQPVNNTSISLNSCGTPQGGWQSGKIYRLTQDITTPAGSFVPCFVIDRDTVTLDGASHRIFASQNSARTAIRVENSASGVTIKNLTIENFAEVGITSERNVANMKIQNNIFRDNKVALSLGGGNTHEITGNTISSPVGFRDQIPETYRVGVNLIGVSNARVLGNQFEGLLLGIESQNSHNNTVERNTFRNNQVGVYINFSGNNSFSANTFDLQSLSALYITGGSVQNSIRNNQLSTSGGGVLVTREIPDLHIQAPVGFDNRTRPIDMNKLAVISMDCTDGCIQNAIEGNTFVRATGRPISITGSDQTTVSGNQVEGITWAVELKDTKNLSFLNNTVRGIINEGNAIGIFGRGTSNMIFENNNLCQNYTNNTVFCERGIAGDTTFSHVNGNTLTGSNCGHGFEDSSICQN